MIQRMARKAQVSLLLEQGNRILRQGRELMNTSSSSAQHILHVEQKSSGNAQHIEHVDHNSNGSAQHIEHDDHKPSSSAVQQTKKKKSGGKRKAERIKKLKESTDPEDVEQVAYDRWLRAGGRDKRMLRRRLKMD
ncbi:unnamed protein product, partial [Prorocentrum cordatum]